MKTSYFSVYKKLLEEGYKNIVSIAGKTLPQFEEQMKIDNRLKSFKQLAPKFWFYQKYKKDGDEEFFKEKYYQEVLNKLNPQEVAEHLGENAILICYEAPGKFCHRRLVAEWLKQNLNIEVEELKL